MEMAKRLNEQDDELEKEMTSIKSHLDSQDKTLGEILTILRGSVSMGVDGVLSKLKEVEKVQKEMISDIEHLKRWKKITQDSRGQITITVSQLFTRILALLGAGGTLIGIILGIKNLFER